MKDVMVGRITLPMGIALEEKYLLRVLLIGIGELVSVPSLNVKLLTSRYGFPYFLSIVSVFLK